jgi:hypothetical protein
VKVRMIGSDRVILSGGIAVDSYDQRGRGVGLSRANGALHCIAMWVGFVMRSEVKLRLKGGHAVLGMTERISIVLRRDFVMGACYPDQSEGSWVLWGDIRSL